MRQRIRIETIEEIVEDLKLILDYYSDEDDNPYDDAITITSYSNPVCSICNTEFKLIKVNEGINIQPTYAYYCPKCKKYVRLGCEEEYNV